MNRTKAAFAFFCITLVWPALQANDAPPKPADPIPEPPASAFQRVVVRVLPQLVRVERGEGAQLAGANRIGAGVIISADGFVVTNSILAGDGQNLNVITHDGKSHPAILIKRDRIIDVAVIKIQAEGLAAADLGDSADIKARQWVMVGGNPFGVARDHNEPLSINKGVVAAVMPIEATGYRYDGPVILTDAAINAGSAGGAVINLEGKVVGVACRTVRATKTNTEVNAAIPINRVKHLIREALDMYAVLLRDNPNLFEEMLPEPQAPAKGYFGAAILDDDTADVGAFVQRVIPISPAFQGGVRAEDLIVAAGGKPIPHGRALLELLETADVGQELELTVNRNGEEIKLTVTLGEEPEAVVH